MVTVDEYTTNDQHYFGPLLPSPRDLATKQTTPIVLYKKGEHVVTLDAASLEDDGKAISYFKDIYRRSFTVDIFHSLADLTGLLKKYNKDLGDSVAVVFSPRSAEEVRQECAIAWSVMAH